MIEMLVVNVLMAESHIWQISADSTCLQLVICGCHRRLEKTVTNASQFWIFNLFSNISGRLVLSSFRIYSRLKNYTKE